MALRQSQHHDQQLAHLKTAVDALTDVLDGRYAKGNPKNVRTVAWPSVPDWHVSTVVGSSRIMPTTAILAVAVVQRRRSKSYKGEVAIAFVPCGGDVSENDPMGLTDAFHKTPTVPQFHNVFMSSRFYRDLGVQSLAGGVNILQ